MDITMLRDTMGFKTILMDKLTSQDSEDVTTYLMYTLTSITRYREVNIFLIDTKQLFLVYLCLYLVKGAAV